MIILAAVGCSTTVHDEINEPNRNENILHEKSSLNMLLRNTVSVSAWRSYAILDDGSLWGWGGIPSSVGIGDGTSETRCKPVKIMEDVLSVVTGKTHTLAVTTDGGLWAWGQNDVGQVGDGTIESRFSPVRIMDDVVYAAVSPFISDTNVCYGARSFAITADNTLWAWGSNGNWELSGVLGDGTTETRLLPVEILDNIVSFTPTFDGGYAMSADGVSFKWDRTRLYPVRIETPYKIHVDSSAPGFYYYIDENASLWTWGDNIVGQLGDGTTEMRLSPVRIMDDIVSLFSSYHIDHGRICFVNIFALASDGTLWAWGGGNRFGSYPNMLGDGTPKNHLTPVRILEGVRISH